MPTDKSQPLKIRLRKAAAMAKRLDEYIAAGMPAGVPPPRRSGILQGTHAVLDRCAEMQQEMGDDERRAAIQADIGAAEALVAALKADPPAPLTAALADQFRGLVGRARPAAELQADFPAGSAADPGEID